VVTLAAVSNLPPMHEDYALFADAFHIRDHKFFNEQWFVSVLQKLYLNAVTVIHNNNHVGDGLYLLSSFYNHSCVPNTRVEFNGNEMRVFAARNIAPGQEIFRSYISAPKEEMHSLSVTQRRQRLHHYFGFWCDCPRCRVELAQSG